MTETTDRDDGHYERLRDLAATEGPRHLQIVDVMAIGWGADEIDRLRAEVARLTPQPPAPSVFAQELATYERMKSALLAYAEGQYCVIQGDACYAVERTYEDALRVGYRALGPVPFLVKQILAVEPVLVMVPH